MKTCLGCKCEAESEREEVLIRLLTNNYPAHQTLTSKVYPFANAINQFGKLDRRPYQVALAFSFHLMSRRIMSNNQALDNFSSHLSSFACVPSSTFSLSFAIASTTLTVVFRAVWTTNLTLSTSP